MCVRACMRACVCVYVCQHARNLSAEPLARLCEFWYEHFAIAGYQYHSEFLQLEITTWLVCDRVRQ